MIKEEFRLLTPAKNDSVLKFAESIAINKDTFISRFSIGFVMQYSQTQSSASDIKLGSM
jgi:hypothetical protein